MGVHGFYVDTEGKDMRFDTVFSFAVDPREALEEVRGAVRALYPDYGVTNQKTLRDAWQKLTGEMVN